jgi:hypothetical protein
MFCLSFTPGFSSVTPSREFENRFNGYTPSFVPLNTGLKPGVNERGNYSPFEAKPPAFRLL